MQRLILALLSAIVLLLAGCGQSGIDYSAETDSYKVLLNLDDARFGERTAQITVQPKSGGAAQVEQVYLTPIMEAMGMAGQEQPAQRQGDGSYQVKADLFNMLGEWEVDVRIAGGGKEEVARFKVQVQE